MNRLRTKWGMRGVAALLLASLLPATFAIAAQAARHTTSYADWVRLQLREPADPAVAQALETASRKHTRTLEAFLKVFVEAYDAQQPDYPLAAAFSALDLSNDALISYLEGRFLGFVDEAVLPRLGFVAAEVVAKNVMKRGVSFAAMLGRSDPALDVRAFSVQPSAIPAFILSIRSISAAQPLGP